METKAIISLSEQFEKFAYEELGATLELGVLLCSLRGYMNLGNHPLTEVERDEVLSRNFHCEMSITRETLWRTLQALAGLAESGHAARPEHAESSSVQSRIERPMGKASDEANGTDDLAAGLRESARVCGLLLEKSHLDFGVWASLSEHLDERIAKSETATRIMAKARSALAGELDAHTFAATAQLAVEDLREDVIKILTGLKRQLGFLHFVERSLKFEGHLKYLIPVFALVHEETLCLLEFIEERTLRIGGADRETAEMLDGTAYALRMELRKAFEHELSGLCVQRQPSHVVARIESANGLLRNSFQQSVVALVQTFDPSVRGEMLFPSFQTRLEQSLKLRGDLWELIRFVRENSKGATLEMRQDILAPFHSFRDGSLLYLMYKDCEPFEKLTDELESAQSVSKLIDVLHRFDAFLETLIGQVNMRAALSGHPFNPKSL